MSIFERIPHGKTSDDVAHQIEALVLEGILRVGEQLPSERDLAIDTGVSRPVVREAIQLLENRKILRRQQGGGTYVNDIIGQVFSDPIADLIGHHNKATVDYLEYRREIEGVAAGFAAERATNSDRELLKKIIDKMKKAHVAANFDDEARVYVELHSLVGEMTHNLVLMHTLRSCYRLLSEGIIKNRERLYDTGGRRAFFDQHMNIANAILEGNKEEAIKASRFHMTYILERNEQVANQMEREKIANLRYKQRS